MAKTTKKEQDAQDWAAAKLKAREKLCSRCGAVCGTVLMIKGNRYCTECADSGNVTAPFAAPVTQPIQPTELSTAQRIAWMHGTGMFDRKGNFIGHKDGSNG
jgi:hypothetical protein